MEILKRLFGKTPARITKKYQYQFTGNRDELRKLCGGFPAADDLYWEYLFGGGFVIFDGALRFFSVCAEPEARNVIAWNKPETWKFEYRELLPEPVWCFAEDVFGCQFCFKDDGVYRLDAETGSLERMGDTFRAWRELVAADADYHTGRPLAADWHDAHDADDPLTPDKILMPCTPFTCNGAYDIANLFPLDAGEAMRLRGDIARQIKELPDGTPIQFQFTP